MPWQNNFYRFADELVAIYRRFGTGPFLYRDVRDVITRQTLSQLMHQGFLVIHVHGNRGPRTPAKAHQWRLDAGVANRCRQTIDPEAATCPGDR